MANLKGSTYEKQIKNASHRMNAIGQKKGNDNNAHSVKTLESRNAMLNDFANYAERNNLDSKLNEAMTTENINNFFNERLDGLKASTAETYIRGFGATIESLQDNNISIEANKTDFNSLVHDIKANEPNVINEGRAINDPTQIINDLNDKNFSHSVVAEVQLELGLRVSEAVEVVNNLDRYLNAHNGTLEGIIGKGGREYVPKEINGELVAKIEDSELVDKREYQRDLQEEGVKSHDFRYTYASNKNDEGLSKAEISEQLNHSREEITDYYLSRA